MKDPTFLPRRVSIRWALALLLAFSWSITAQTESAQAQWLKNIIGRVSTVDSGPGGSKRGGTGDADSSNENGSRASGEPGAAYSVPHLTLSDAAEHTVHDYPEVFLHSPEDDAAASPQSGMDAGLGYRIQILSTRSVALADTVQLQFRIWADSTFGGAVPEAYLFFKPPHYRIHVGDFTDRDQANRFARLLKRRYADAWVVYDRIDPAKAAGSSTLKEDGTNDGNAPAEDSGDSVDSEASDVETEQ